MWLIKKNIRLFFIAILTGIVLACCVSISYADSDLISLFPIDHYNQSISAWIKPDADDFNQSLLTTEMQQQRYAIFLDHYIGTLSPWNTDYINSILHQASPNDLATIEQSIIANFDNEDKSSNQISYGENFRPYQKAWIEEIANNINVSQLMDLNYQDNNRGIAIDNLHARALPTDDVSFYSHTLAGEGYPFDNLQMSGLWAGTPVYILGQTRDQEWMLVATPDFIAWVKSNGIARADSTFVNEWITASENQLAAISHTKTSMIEKNGNHVFTAYVGSVFPATETADEMELLVPAMNSDHKAITKKVSVQSNHAVVMPLAATPHNFSMMMNTLIGRPYGWGSMYFYNDCSAETKSLLTPFGIWLPRHSSDQVTVGKMVDISGESAEKRLSYLISHGRKFLTLIYIGGHVILYIGNYANSDNETMAMTYQNVWGLAPSPAVRRAVIGESVLFPLLLQYPEDTSLTSLAGKKYFQLSYLNELPNLDLTFQHKKTDLKSLMYPESQLKNSEMRSIR